MPRVDPGLMPVVVDLERRLRELGIPFFSWTFGRRETRGLIVEDEHRLEVDLFRWYRLGTGL